MHVLWDLRAFECAALVVCEFGLCLGLCLDGCVCAVRCATNLRVVVCVLFCVFLCVFLCVFRCREFLSAVCVQQCQTGTTECSSSHALTCAFAAL